MKILQMIRKKYWKVSRSLAGLIHLNQENVYDRTTRRSGNARPIITTVEQLFQTPEGHFTRLGSLIRDRQFQKYIKCIHVDKSHSIHTAGLPRNGIATFRFNWGNLGAWKAPLPSTITCQAISATLPLHMIKIVENQILGENYISIWDLQ